MNGGRQVKAIGLLPGMVTIVIPAGIIAVAGADPGSRPASSWCGVPTATSAIPRDLVPLVEEPGLVRRFGADYEEYSRHVPRWLPQRRVWLPPGR